MIYDVCFKENLSITTKIELKLFSNVKEKQNNN